jgi:uncharacterized protein YkwD
MKSAARRLQKFPFAESTEGGEQRSYAPSSHLNQRKNHWRCSLFRNFIILQFTIVAASLFATFAAPAVAQNDDLARQVLVEINLARAEPGTYAEFLRQFRRQFHGNSYLLPESKATVQTREGVAAVGEAIDFLAKQVPLPPLALSAGLAAAAAEQVVAQGRSGATGHGPEKKGGILGRVERHGIAADKIGENIAYGQHSSARAIVIDLIVDDGVPNRGHRRNQFDPTFTMAGVSCGPHPRYEGMCVIVFSSGPTRSSHKP